ncbi:hypothetical protein COCVIDRAFT_36492 [Bipolaris victoriae FI3]|uniref:Alpha-L-rhamnosidase C-terminal domain-containing protein n=1 Tax=Bipolaris victoriae (strain FI3) TaxID=930091 RepID=W7EDE5_BIPV3|nr:hypothetical protein COCVIDRAFT_36492 [Bipolaris victoriae FI3]
MASPNSNIPTPVPFPQPPGIANQDTSNSGPESPTTNGRDRSSTNASTVSSRLRSATGKLMEANPPPGMWAATGTTAARAPSLSDIRTGSFGSDGWNEHAQRSRAGSRASRHASGSRTSTTVTATSEQPEPSHAAIRRTSSNNVLGTQSFPALVEEDTRQVLEHDAQHNAVPGAPSKHSSDTATEYVDGDRPQQPKRTSSGRYTNGYIPPPKLPWKQTFAISLKSFWTWFLTPAGFLITLYCLNIVAWGGMLFLLLCNAAPAMCKPTCDDINSPRRVWIEIDSQILNALFCVTGFGLAPWRFRDLYWWAWWRVGGSKRTETGIRRLAGIHRGWFRLPGSDRLPDDADATCVDPLHPAVPIPLKAIPDPPPTAMRAPPTKSWTMDVVVWFNVWNTLFQICLCFYMWHYDRIQRPSWATGLFVALACGVSGAAGYIMWQEGNKVKKIEGVPMRKDYGPTDAEASLSVPLVKTGVATKS